MLRYLTSGESHGSALMAVLEGLPAGLVLRSSHIDRELERRQGGYGRGGRMQIEKDRVRIISGVRHTRTLGSPIGLLIRNLDWANWKTVMSTGAVPAQARGSAVTRPRPGHADLAGALKYGAVDIRDILERSSARETAARVAVGAVAKRFLDLFSIRVLSWVDEIGGVEYKGRGAFTSADTLGIEKLFTAAEASAVRCPGRKATSLMQGAIDRARKAGNSVGGGFVVIATGVPPGLGSHVLFDRKLDARLAGALMSIQAIKGVEVGLGFDVAHMPGSRVHDEIFYSKKKPGPGAGWPPPGGYYRKTNNAGGIEGGISNGEPVVLRAAMKPIPTLHKPLRSVDMRTKKAFTATYERSDVCAVPAAAVIGEAVVAFELAAAFMEKFSGDSMREIKRSYRGYLKQLSSF